MSIQYPGGTIVNTTFIGATKQDIVSNLETQLTLAGWSVVSGAGTTDVLLQSGSTPTANNFILVRLRSTILTNCCCVNMQNAAADRVSPNFFLFPGAAKTYRIAANQYQWFCFTGGTSAAREYVGTGVLYIPSFLHGVIVGELGWISGNGESDTTVTVRASFRTLLECAGITGSVSQHYCGLVNGSLVQGGGITGGPGSMRLVTQQGALVQSVNGYRWHDDSIQLVDPLIAWGLTSATTDEAKIRGQLWGAMIATDAFAGDTILTAVDGHDWLAVTNSNVGSANDARGTLFVAIT